MKLNNLPNLVSISRCAIAICLFGTEIFDLGVSNIIYAVFFSLAFFSDALDGWLARLFNAVSDLGAWLDLFADKIMFLALWCHILNNSFSILINISVFLLIVRELVVTLIRYLAINRLVVAKHGKYKTAYLGALGIITLLCENADAVINLLLPLFWILGVLISWYSLILYINAFFNSYAINK